MPVYTHSREIRLQMNVEKMVFEASFSTAEDASQVLLILNASPDKKYRITASSVVKGLEGGEITVSSKASTVINGDVTPPVVTRMIRLSAIAVDNVTQEDPLPSVVVLSNNLIY